MERRSDDARSDGIGANIVLGQIGGHVPRQVVHRRLGRGIHARAQPAAIVARDRAQIDNRPSAALLHMGHRRLRRDDYRAQIEVHDVVIQPVVEIHEQGAGQQRAGIVDKHIDTAQFGRRALNHVLRRLRFRRKVGLEDVDLAAVGADRVGDRFGLVAALVVVDGQPGAQGGEALGCGGADAGRCAGDDHGLALEVLPHEILRHFQTLDCLTILRPNSRPPVKPKKAAGLESSGKQGGDDHRQHKARYAPTQDDAE